MPLPPVWNQQVGTQLTDDETVLAWLEIDLNAQLRFTRGLVVLTNQHLLAKSADDASWKIYAFRHGLALTRRDHSGHRRRSAEEW